MDNLWAGVGKKNRKCVIVRSPQSSIHIGNPATAGVRELSNGVTGSRRRSSDDGWDTPRCRVPSLSAALYAN